MKKILLLAITIVLAALSANIFGWAYSYFSNVRVGFSGFIVPEFWRNFINGIFLSYVFFLSLLFTAFGGAKKYWWLGILLIPAVVFEIYFDLSHIYFPVLLGLASWVLGFLLFKIFRYFR